MALPPLFRAWRAGPRPVALVLALLLLACAATASATDSVFPFYARTDGLSEPEPQSRERSYMWPFGHAQETTTYTLTALHPLYTRMEENSSTPTLFMSVLWPIVTSEYVPEDYRASRRRTFSILPVLYSTEGIRPDTGEPFRHRYVLPFLFSGHEEPRRPPQDPKNPQPHGTGDYTVLFPFFWKADEAKTVIPLFPKRPQTFQAVWPIAGKFEGFWNRDLIEWFLWPFYVHSVDSTGVDQFESTFFLWPIFGRIHGDGGINGFRVWPLYTQVHKEGEFFRANWLWPLGHRRVGRISETNEGHEDVTLFLPFYGKVTRPTWSHEHIFPVYGRLATKGRIARGYGLGFYNTDDDLRDGIRQHRLIWFVIRWTSKIPATVPKVNEPNQRWGGGVFPFYLHTGDKDQERWTVAWPFYHRRISDYEGETFKRAYFFPFFARQNHSYDDGSEQVREFLWPFYRRTRERDGRLRVEVLHLFPYLNSWQLDNTWAPLWQFYKRRVDPNSGAASTEVMEGLYRNEVDAEGNRHRRFDALIFRAEASNGPDVEREHHTQFLFGLAGHHREGGRKKMQLLWMKIPYGGGAED